MWDTFNWLHEDALLENEPPKHTRLKALVAKAFSRGMIESRRGRIQELCRELLDDCEAKLAETGSFDVVADYAEPLPVLVIADLLGVPESDVGPLRPWSQDIVKMYEYDRTAEDDARARALVRRVRGVRRRARARPARCTRRRPGHPPRAGRVRGREAHRARARSPPCVLLLNAGHEATVNGFGNGIVALLDRRDQWDARRRRPVGRGGDGGRGDAALRHPVAALRAHRHARTSRSPA